MTNKFSGNTILIIDDNPTNLGVLVDYLEAFGLEIMTARSGQDGLEKAVYFPPDLILLDVMMPGIDGFETCRRLKKNEVTRDIPVIFITALTNTEDKVVGFQVGAIDYITKPFQQAEVLARVTTHLQLRGLTEHLEQKVEERTEALNQAYQTLERLDKAKADFIDVMSHELRTPMTAVDGYTQLLKEYTTLSDDPQASDLMDKILIGSERMLGIINHIFDATRIENNVLTLRRVPLALDEVIGTVCQEFEPVLAQRELTLICDNLKDLGMIEGDNRLLSKAFYHLIINAIKYTPNGGQISIAGRHKVLEAEPLQIEIVIKDTGIGLDPEHHLLIFERFYQVAPVASHFSGATSYKGGGPGLGLTIAKSVISRHGGQVWVESEGQDEETFPGCRFFVRLPIKEDSR